MPDVPLITSGLSTATNSQTAVQSVPVSAQNLENATPANQRVVWRRPGTFKNLYIRVSANGITSGAIVYHFQKNGVDGNMSVSVPISTTGEFEDLVNSDSVVAGDDVCYTSVQGSGGTINTEIWACVFTDSVSTTQRLSTGYSGGITAVSSTFFNQLTGPFAGSAAESDVQHKSKTAGTFSNLFVRISANASTNASTWRIRLNGADQLVSLSVPSNSTGNFEDTTHSTPIFANDLVNISFTVGATSNNITCKQISVDFTTKNGQFWLFIGSAGSGAAANVTTYRAIAGSTSANTTESSRQTKMRVRFRAQNLLTHIIANTITLASTINFRKNTANGNMSVSITASTTGYFEDAVNTDQVELGDEINYQIITPNSGTSMTIADIGILGTNIYGKALQLNQAVNRSGNY